MASSRSIAIVVTGEPIAAVRERRGGFAALIRDAAGELGAEFAELDARSGALPEPGAFAAIVITGSAASVTERAPWMLAAEERLRQAVAGETPVLGICFGHQMLAQALGGRVEKNPSGREIGTVELELVEDDPLLDREQHPFLVNMTHVDSVVDPPAGAQVLARSALDPYAALRFGPRAWGVQFHPEIDAEVLRDYAEGRRQQIAAEGLDVEAVLRGIAQGAAGRETLRRFVRGALGGG